jgi:hypothetical protein
MYILVLVHHNYVLVLVFCKVWMGSQLLDFLFKAVNPYVVAFQIEKRVSLLVDQQPVPVISLFV